MSDPKPSLLQRYMALPKKVRLYIGLSTFLVAFAGDRITKNIEENNAIREEAEKRLAMQQQAENSN